MTAYKPYKGNYRLNAGYRYSNGTLHAAWDIGMPIGTPLYAPRDGIVLDCNDGVKNDGPNSPDYTNEPSNWILLGIEMNGQKYGFYSQHMSPGLKVRKGEHVVAGQLLGYSGDSGNSSGPHWHNAVQKTWSLNRYLYLNSPSMCVYPPNKVWGERTPGGPVLVDQKYPGRKAVRKAAKDGHAPWVSKVKKALKKAGYEPGHVDDQYTSMFKQAVRKYKRDHKLGLTSHIGKRMWNKLDIKRVV